MGFLDALGLRTPPDAPHKQRMAELRTKTSAHIPYACHYDDFAVMTRNDALLLTIKIEGLAFETADVDELAHKKELRNNLLRTISGSRHAVYVHTVLYTPSQRRVADVLQRRRTLRKRHLRHPGNETASERRCRPAQHVGRPITQARRT
jgi:hypothetical protein